MLQQGAIVWATVKDTRGGNPKKRPVIVLTSNHEIRSGDVFVGIVCSNSAALVVPLPDSCVRIPFDPAGKCRTLLRKPTVAVIGWYAEVPVDAIAADDVGGVIPSTLLATIIMRLSQEQDGN
jgi:hypothetical protein